LGVTLGVAEGAALAVTVAVSAGVSLAVPAAVGMATVAVSASSATANDSTDASEAAPLPQSKTTQVASKVTIKIWRIDSLLDHGPATQDNGAACPATHE
jgi:hypothetical protein